MTGGPRFGEHVTFARVTVLPSAERVWVDRVDLSLKPGRLERLRQPPRERAGRFDPAIVAVFAAVVSAAGAARPSLWFDEAATISASGSRSVPELWALLGNIDAVHGLYYLVMHGWFAVFPATEFWSRMSSCLAVGGAAAGVVVLGRQFSTRSVAVCAGIAFAILPRITWAGIEARSYALSALAAVWLTVLLVQAARRDRVVLWPLYAVGLVVSTLLNLFVVLIVLAHAVVVSVVAGRRPTIVRWAVAACAAVVIVVPFLVFCRTQIAQVHWISPIGPHTVVEIVREQYFDHSVPFAVLAGVLLVALIVLCRKGIRAPDTGDRRLAVVAVAWMVLPTAVLLLYSVWLKPIYYPRYLCFTSPGMALLLGVCIVALAQARERITAVLAAFALAATPNYLLVQRGPYAKEGMDYSHVADVITERAAPGDCLIMDNTVTWLPGPIRALTAARPSAYEKLVDPGRGLPAVDRNWLWDGHLGIRGVADRIRQCTVLWTVSERDDTVPDAQSGPALDPGPRLARSPAYRVPQQLGFHVVQRWQFSFAQVTKSTR
jgi:mannosyltransferase